MSLLDPYSSHWIISSADNSLVEILNYQSGTEETNSYTITDLQLSQLREAMAGISDYSYHSGGTMDCDRHKYQISFSSSGEINVNITRCYFPSPPPVNDAIIAFTNRVTDVIGEVTGVQ